MIKLGFVLILFVVLSCSDISSSEEENKVIIEQTLTDISIAFNFDDLSGIMDRYHPDFLHNGNDWNDEEFIWEGRMIEYLEMEITDVEIDLISSSRATAEFILTFRNSETEVIWNEPSEENGDLSYFSYVNSEWKISGNQIE